MSTARSVTPWIYRYPDEGARDFVMQVFFDHYYDPLGRFLRRCCGRFRGKEDEDDAVLSAFLYLHNYLIQHKDYLEDLFPNRDRLVGLLFRTALWRAQHQIRDENRDRRGGGRVVRESDSPASNLANDCGEESPGLDWITDSEPSPEMLAQWRDECAYLLGKCNTRQRDILLAIMEGRTQPEIAKEMYCCLATVERELDRMRKRFQKEAQP
jgi:DNA-directed RNA polymerase specialized sigma24 family protein